MRSKGFERFFVHREFKLFFLTSTGNSDSKCIVNSRGYFRRWVDSYNFIFNLFFVESHSQLMGSKLFLEEALAFNWQGDKKHYKIYKYTQPYLMFSDMSHGVIVHQVVDTLVSQNFDFFIVADIKTHRRLLGYMKARNLFLIGLIPVNYSPWLVSYPIPAFADSHLVQFIFLKFVMRLHLHAKALNHSKLFNLR